MLLWDVCKAGRDLGRQTETITKRSTSGAESLARSFSMDSMAVMLSLRLVRAVL